MRRTLALLAFTGALIAAPAALAGPTCETKLGQTIRCGVPGAMPVGWSLPADQRVDLDQGGLSPFEGLCLIALLGGLFGLIALMPDFDGFSEE